jgi:8-oxo-dGTP diphosphatase
MAHSSSRVVLTVDAVITDHHGRILLMERGTEPFRGDWVLPGGLVDPGETVEEAVVREVREELGLTVEVVRLIGVFSTPGRDPRGSFVSLAFHVRITGGEVIATEEAPAHRWLVSGEQVSMGFDHAAILQVFRGQ